MLSRVWKESAPGPFVDPFNDFTSWNDGRFLAERGTPDRFAYPPNTSTPNFLAIPLLSWARKKESNASLISLFSFSRILAIPSKRIRDAKLSTISRKKKEETIESWKRDERVIFRKRKIRGQIYEKNHERINFPQNPSFENFEAMIKIAWSGHSPGEEEGEEKKQRRRRRKRRRKWKKERRKDNRYLNGKYNFFNECFNCSWIFIFTSVLWTFNKAVFTRREVWRSGDGEERREEVKIFPYGRLLLDFKAKRILAKFEAKGTKKERNMNIYK